MEGILVPIFAIIFVFGGPVLVIIMIAKFRHDQKMEMIRQGINPNKRTTTNQGAKSLLLGLMLTFLGIAALISTFYHSDFHVFSIGLLILCAGLAFLLYWKLTTPERERERRLYEERLKAEIASLPKTTPQPSCPETESPAPETDDRIV